VPKIGLMNCATSRLSQSKVMSVLMHAQARNFEAFRETAAGWWL